MLDKSILLSYLRQQKQLSMPELIFNKPLDFSLLVGTPPMVTDKVVPQKPRGEIQVKTVFEKKPIKPVENTNSGTEDTSILSSRLAALRPINQIESPLISRRLKSRQETVTANEQQATIYSTFDQKRAALKTLYYEGCKRCTLSQTRNTFVFGAGAANAPVMVIGEAPGAEEDAQGLPFVGAAGQLLTSMLTAIKLDRNKNVFITNILKCRPPENRNPENVEIITCVPILEKQISIIQPKAILLLGRIAAHSLLGLADSIAKLRSKTHLYKNIPAMVIYHPAALLRNAEYKRPAWEDLQKFQQLLTDLGVYE